MLSKRRTKIGNMSFEDGARIKHLVTTQNRGTPVSFRLFSSMCNVLSFFLSSPTSLSLLLFSSIFIVLSVLFIYSFFHLRYLSYFFTSFSNSLSSFVSCSPYFVFSVVLSFIVVICPFVHSSFLDALPFNYALSTTVVTQYYIGQDGR